MIDRRDNAAATRFARIEIGVAVAVVFLCGVFARQRIDFDGMAFIGRVADTKLIDPAHPLYPPLFFLVAKIAAVFGFTIESAGRFLSAVGAAVTFWATSSLARRLGAAAPAAVAGGLAIVTAPILLLQATTIEVHALATAALATSFACAAKHHASMSLRHWILALLAFAVAVMLHVATSLGIFALIAFSGGFATLRRFALLHVAIILFAAIAILVGLRIGLDVRELWAQAQHFVEVRRTGDPHPWSSHAALALRIAREDTLVPIAAAVAAVIVGARKLRPTALALTAWVLPFVAVYLWLGIPVIGLLLPGAPAFAVAAAIGLSPHPAASPKIARSVPIAFLAFVVAAFLLTAADRRREAMTPDPDREAALLLAKEAPENAVLFSGIITHHVRRYTKIEAVSVAELMRQWQNRGIPPDRFPAELRALAKEKSARGTPILIDSDAGRALIAQMGRPFEIDTLYHPTPQLQIRKDPPLIVCLMKLD